MEWLENKHNYIFIGESGSGKTELSINLALKLKEISESRVVFVDMDQTKVLFRARDHKEKLRERGIDFLETVEMADSPIIPIGVSAALEDPNAICVFDVGGNATGAIMIGQFSEVFTTKNTEVLFVLNPYRLFSGDAKHVDQTLSHILKTAGIPREQISFIANPYFGKEMDIDTISSGYEKVVNMAEELGYPVKMLAVEEQYAEHFLKKESVSILKIHSFIEYLDGMMK